MALVRKQGIEEHHGVPLHELLFPFQAWKQLLFYTIIALIRYIHRPPPTCVDGYKWLLSQVEKQCSIGSACFMQVKMSQSLQQGHERRVA